MQRNLNLRIRICYLNFTDLKILKHIISITIWTLLGLYLLLIITVHIPYIQETIGTQVSSLVSKKLGTRVYIGKVDLGIFNRLIIDDVLIYDQSDKEMLKATRLSARFDILPLTKGRISISSIQIFGSHITLYKAGARPNFQFVLDSLASKDTTSSTPLDLRVNSFIMQRSSVRFDRYDTAPTSGKLNPAHLHIRDISAHVSLKALKNDSINLAIKKLAFTEQSGLRLNRLSLKLEGGRNHCLLRDLKIKLPGSEIHIGDISADYGYTGEKIDLSTLRFRGSIEESTIAPADISFIIPEAKAFGGTPLTVTSVFEWTRNSLRVSSLRLRSVEPGELDLKAQGRIEEEGGARSWQMAVRSMDISQPVLELAAGYKGKASPAIRNVVSRIGDIHISGTANSLPAGGIEAVCGIESGAGDVDMSVNISRDKGFSGTVQASGIDLRRILGNNDLGLLSAKTDMRGRLGNALSVKASSQISQFDYKNHKYSGISIDGEYGGKRLSGKLRIDDPGMSLNAEGAFGKQGKTADVKLKAYIHSIKPQAVNLSDKWGDAVFSARIDADIRASGINDAAGYVRIGDFSMVSSEDALRIKDISMTSGMNDGTHYYIVNGDFGNIGITGDFDYNTLGSSIANIVRDKLPTLPGLPQEATRTRNDFYIKARITNSDWLEKLLGVPLRLNEPMDLTGKVDDAGHRFFVNCLMPDFSYNGKPYTNGSAAVTLPDSSLCGDVHVTKVMDNGKLLNLSVSATARDNNLAATVNWGNNSVKRQSGTLNAVARFTRDKEALVEIKRSRININDTVWNIEPSRIAYSKDRVDIDRFAVTRGSQHIIVNGTASKLPTDSLTVDLNDIDIEYILDLVNFHSVEFSGRATGKAYIAAPLSDMAASGRLVIENFRFEGGRMGTLNAGVDWNKEDGQIDIQAIAHDGPQAGTYINGYVSPTRGYIDLQIEAAGTRIDFMRSFTRSFMSDIGGSANGVVRLAGPLSAINLTGLLTVSGDFTVRPLNCKYRMTGDTITFVPDEIKLSGAPIYDTHGNRGSVSGSIYHKHLTRLSYRLAVEAENLLAYNFSNFGDDTFCGTVYGSGNVTIDGGNGEVRIAADITPQKNSQFLYNASRTDDIADQEFIQWRDNTVGTAAGGGAESDGEQAPAMNTSTDIHMDLNIHCTPDAALRLLMDSRANDYITLYGNGDLRARYYNKGAFSMAGTFTVTHGTYGITIQDIIKKSFVFSEGGTITFRGNPYDADLNLQAIHTVNGVSLSDLNIGSSFSNNTTRVNCLMNITGQPRAPRIDFDMDMPTMSTDEKQMIRSVIESNGEMSQQVLYLLGVGRFYPPTESNVAMQGGNQQSRTSLAMQSLLSGTISGQINNVLNSVINSNNWNFGASISTGDEGWNNAEYEGLLSGRLLNNRLLINGQFGYRDNANTTNTSSFIGDFDIRYLLQPNGNIAVNVYNKTNDRYFTKSSLNTQGIGIIMKKDFNGLKDLLKIRRKRKTKAPDGKRE